ncbi:ATP-binding protein [Petroclostridium sp. X23]|uniref:ATP-binding protein n=1 Tax=Petroclostridium sp. X23 TaxID=3045146 RepID=UPI0024AD5DEE|nr:ATP-binding protein [Petroclostridium sp. X23]WHH58388.1 ATP-binding protein [Petroclostridium sp. X23]
MKICVLSGKGGAGKTLVAVNLAYVVHDSAYIDCDVEEPNGAIFLKSDILKRKPVDVKVPEAISERCKGCRKCIQFCKFNALAFIKNKVTVFPELCHSCGGCVKACDFGALKEIERSIGVIEEGVAGDVRFYHGILNHNEPTGVAIIKELLSSAVHQDKTIIDCPPGCSCSVMESIDGCDFCILVTEPTLFGIHNMNMVYELTKLFSIPCGVVINKAITGNHVAHDFCREHNIPILMEIPFSKEIARLSSEGLIISSKLSDCRQKFLDMHHAMMEVKANEAVSHSQR